MPTGIISGGQTYSVGGAGYVLVGDLPTTPIADADDFCAVQWSGNLEIEERDVTNTCDFNVDTGLTNSRSIVVSTRMTGQLVFDHNLDPTRDVLALLPVGSYRRLFLFINRGNLAATGPPAVVATRRAYFDVPEAKMGPVAIEGGAPNEQRRVTISFTTNGVFNYVNEEVPATP